MEDNSYHKKNHLGNSKLVQLLKTLSPKELKKLKNHLSSAWCKKNKYYLPLYERLLQTAPTFSGETLEKEKVYQYLYKKKPYNNLLFNNLLLALTKEVQNYIAFLMVQAQTGKSAVEYLQLNRLHQEAYFQASGQYRYQQEVPHLETANEALDAFYLLEKYKYYLEATARAKILKMPTPASFTVDNLLLQSLQNKLALEAITLYQLRVSQPTTITWEVYQQFKTSCLTAFPNLSLQLQQTFLILCINDVVQLDRMGHPLAMEELFGWYQIGLANECLMEHGYLDEAAYNNIVLVAEQKLPAPIRQDVHKWALAQLALQQGRYEEVRQAFVAWLPKEKKHAIQARVTLLKAHFKLAIADKVLLKNFEAACAAFKVYMRRDKLYTVDKNLSYLKFIQYAKKIVNYQHQPIRPKNWDLIEKALEQEPVLAGKRWLKKELALLQT